MEGGLYDSGGNLEELYELLEGGFLEDDEDFNREFENVQETVERNEVYACEICGKNVNVQKVWKGMKPSSIFEKVHPKPQKKRRKTVLSTLQISKFEEIVKEFAKLCHADLCLP